MCSDIAVGVARSNEMKLICMEIARISMYEPGNVYVTVYNARFYMFTRACVRARATSIVDALIDQ